MFPAPSTYPADVYPLTRDDSKAKHRPAAAFHNAAHADIVQHSSCFPDGRARAAHWLIKGFS